MWAGSVGWVNNWVCNLPLPHLGGLLGARDAHGAQAEQADGGRGVLGGLLGGGGGGLGGGGLVGGNDLWVRRQAASGLAALTGRREMECHIGGDMLGIERPRPQRHTPYPNLHRGRKLQPQAPQATACWVLPCSPQSYCPPPPTSCHAFLLALLHWARFSSAGIHTPPAHQGLHPCRWPPPAPSLLQPCRCCRPASLRPAPPPTSPRASAADSCSSPLAPSCERGRGAARRGRVQEAQ